MTTLRFVKQTEEELADLGASYHQQYISGDPYPHIVLDDFFCPEAMEEILSQTPSLAKSREGVQKMSNRNEEKYATVGEKQFGETTKHFVRFLNAEPFLRFLEKLTGIENLLPDPHFEGGGHHEILPGGFLKIHADFGKNATTGLDRRLNALVYLNQDWKEEYGGHFELWDVEMKGCVKKVLPLFNRLVVFTTTSFTYHGHPEPLRCPPDRSRRSLALYYYTNGRPVSEVLHDGAHSTLFKARPNSEDDSASSRIKDQTKKIIKAITPPILIDVANKVLGR